MTIGIAIVGVRGYGKQYFGAIAASGHGTVRALCDLDLAAAQALASEHGVPYVHRDLQQVLADPLIDAVLLATPHHLHHAQVMAALEAGKHVLCEKPLAIQPAHAWELAAAARRRSLVLSCHYNQRQSAVVKTMRRLVHAGALGTVYHAQARWLARWTRFLVDPQTSWRVRPEQAGGGILIGRGSHLIDALLYILGHPEVSAVEATTASAITPHAIDDLATATLHLASGGSLHISCTYLAHHAGRGEEMSYEVLGDKGGVSWCTADGRVLHGGAGRCDPQSGVWQELSACPAADAEQLEPHSIIEDFLGAVACGTPLCVTAEQAALVVELVSAAYRAAASGSRIAIRSPALSSP